MSKLQRCEKRASAVAKTLVSTKCRGCGVPRYVGTGLLFSFVVAWTAPTKHLPRNQRLRLLVERATVRYNRRRAAVVWLENWTRKKWGNNPRLSTRVSYSIVRHLRLFATMRPRITRYKHSDGTEVRLVGQHICYEDCVHLAEQAYLLLEKLVRSARI